MGKARRGALAIAATVCCLVGFAIAASGASASLEFESTSVTVNAPGDTPVLSPFGFFDYVAGGTPIRDAGAHPDLAFHFKVPKAESVRNINLALPPGFIGDPTSAPTCKQSDFYSTAGNLPDCPVPSQIGFVRGLNENPAVPGFYGAGIFNLDHGPGVPARFGFSWLGAYIFIEPTVRPDDYGLSSGSKATTQVETVREAEVTIWGVPQDPAHDALRVAQGGYPPTELPGIPSEGEPQPFLRTPTSCSEEPVTFTAEGNSWEEPGVFDVIPMTSDPDGVEFRFEGCENLPFAPTLAASTTSSAADSPTGLAIDIEVPQNEDPYGLSTSDVRKVVTTFPQGMTVSDSSAAGLGSCSQGQIGIGSTGAPSCPDSSKLGTVKIDTPVLDEQLEGNLYLAKQNDNPFGSLLAIYLAVKGPGFYLKLPGKVDLDPVTGQMTTTFSETPQLPFEHLRLELRSGPRAPMTTPRECGTYAVKSEFVPWSGTAPVLGESKFTVSENCSKGFAPKLRAGTASPAAGSSSPFTLQVTREDGEQNLSAIDVTLPEGLLAKLAGVPLCGDAQAATGDCPAASQVGKTVVGAGSGPTPVFVPEAGKAPTAVYLAGPFKGAPFSLVVKVPAQAGPFDLGTVAVRSGIYVDPVTARASVKSDPLPQILQGIPIAYRDVRVEVDRPGFIQTPTGCEAMKVESTIYGSGGASASPAANYQASNCDRLGFKPKLSLKFTGPTHRSAHPALKATLTMPKKGANIGKAVVTLPRTEFLENAHIRTICTRVQYAADNCPKESIYGYAKAWTPLLDKPLQGPVYLRSSNHTLPDLVASLDGQIHIDLAGRIDSPGGKIRNTFWAVPDAPVSKFVLRMQGGDKGLLVNNEELCKAKPRAKAEFTGQNGKRSVSNPLVKLGCGKSPRKR
jgi:hypothetical protein